VRFGHTGELGGIAGQLIAGTASFGGVILVWTGLALAVRRFAGWRLWRRWSNRRSDITGSLPAVAPAGPLSRRLPEPIRSTATQEDA